MRIGYTMMCEQAGPRQLVRDVVRAEEAGFDLAVISDHDNPWLDSQGHSPYAWSVLGVAAQATEDTFLDWAPKELLPARREL
jgi:alkanesulfonate monooxygenase SsuD/methylene tetrahydromethanopterin reductase-like flavin-dependent oxidoreductase (luciferase family)